MTCAKKSIRPWSQTHHYTEGKVITGFKTHHYTEGKVITGFKAWYQTHHYTEGKVITGFKEAKLCFSF